MKINYCHYPLYISALLIPFGIITGPFLGDFFITIVSLSFVFVTFKERIYKYYNNIYFKFIFLFWLYLTIRSLFISDIYTFHHKLESFTASFAYIRFFIAALAIWYLLDTQKSFLKFFLFISFFSYLFVLLDGYFQNFNGKDVFGFSKPEKRLTGPFGKEQVLGSYLARNIPLLVATFILFFGNKKRYLINFLIFFSVICSFLSGERTSFALMFFFSLLYLFFYNQLFYKKIIIFVLTFIILSSVFLLNKESYQRFYYETGASIGILPYEKGIKNYETSEPVFKKFFLYSEAHQTHIRSAIMMFKENIFFGQGVKMFRYKCKDPNIYINDMSCTTHPHNTLAQFLGETGLVGSFFLLVIIIYLIKELFNFFNKKLKKIIISDKNLAKSCLILSFCITFMIILPSGNFFNNWLSTQNFLPLGFYFYVHHNNNN
jgi:hypothetical protein